MWFKVIFCSLCAGLVVGLFFIYIDKLFNSVLSKLDKIHQVLSSIQMLLKKQQQD